MWLYCQRLYRRNHGDLYRWQPVAPGFGAVESGTAALFDRFCLSERCTLYWFGKDGAKGKILIAVTKFRKCVKVYRPCNILGDSVQNTMIRRTVRHLMMTSKKISKGQMDRAKSVFFNDQKKPDILFLRASNSSD